MPSIVKAFFGICIFVRYWQSAAEKEGKGPMSTVLPYIVIFGFMTPFIILGLGFANGWIKVPIR